MEYTSYESLISQGYKDGFNIDWGSVAGGPGTNDIRNNSMIIQTSTNTPETRVGNLNGIKFLYKINDSTIEWKFIYVWLDKRDPNTYHQTHASNNVFFLQVNGATILNNQNVIISTGSNTLYSSLTEYSCSVISSGTINISDISQNKFTVTARYYNQYYYSGVIAAAFYNAWPAYNNFTTGSAQTYSVDCYLTPSEDDVKIYEEDGSTEITNAQVSYGQTIVIKSTGNKVRLMGTNYSSDETWVDNQGTYNLGNIQKVGSNYPTTIYAQAKV